MNEFKNKPEPKKIKMPPLVDRSKDYDTMSWLEQTLETTNENYSENNSEGLSELESD